MITVSTIPPMEAQVVLSIPVKNFDGISTADVTIALSEKEAGLLLADLSAALSAIANRQSFSSK